MTLALISSANYPGWNVNALTSLTSSGTTATATTTVATNIQSGSSVTIAGATPSAYNGTYVVTVTGTNTFTYTFAGGTSPATGTKTATGGRLTVPGVVWMDGYFFVMDTQAVIYNCDLNTPATWNALSFIGAIQRPGIGVALNRIHNYVVAFKDSSIEFFYDAGNSPGSPLSPYQGAFLEIGCAAGTSVVNTSDTLFFLGQTRQTGRRVYKFNGMVPEPVSTTDVERILIADDLATVRAFSALLGGHQFYILTLVTSNITLAYDDTTKTWAKWTSLTAQSPKSVTTLTQVAGVATATVAAHGYADGDPVLIAGANQSGYNGTVNISYVDANTFTYTVASATVTPATGTITAVGYTEGYFKYSNYVACGGRDLLLGESDGNLYQLAETTFQDNSLPINVVIQTSLIDGQDDKGKFWKELRVIGDKVAGTARVRYTNDDYQTFSAYRSIDLSSIRARLSRLGKAARRAFTFRYTDNTALRVESLELTAGKGSEK